MSGKNEKGRDWTFIVYPDSAPENWREILDETHMRWVESPLHDKDVDSDGEIKKAHWHILLSAEGPITYSAVSKIIEPLNCPVHRKVGSSKGLVRYMVHYDNPEKYQYSKSDIVGHNGADVDSYFEMTLTARLDVMKEIVKFIYDNDCTNYADFLMYCILNEEEWFNVAINHNTLAINKVLDAMWQKKMSKSKKIEFY